MTKKNLLLALTVLGIVCLFGLAIWISKLTPIYKIISVSPGNGQNNIPANEIMVSIQFNQPIKSATELNYNISPSLPYYWKFANAFPSSRVDLKVYGGLKPSTQYTINITDKAQHLVYSWSFTTSNQQPVASSALVHDQEEANIAKYKPLFNLTPYQGSDFKLWYTGNLSLVVHYTNPNLDLVKEEVNNWLKSQKVEPSTHTINYIQDAN